MGERSILDQGYLFARMNRGWLVFWASSLSSFYGVLFSVFALLEHERTSDCAVAMVRGERRLCFEYCRLCGSVATPGGDFPADVGTLFFSGALTCLGFWQSRMNE